MPFFLRQHRTELVVQDPYGQRSLTSQIFRQFVQKSRRWADAQQGISVQDGGKFASRCATKPLSVLCAVLP